MRGFGGLVTFLVKDADWRATADIVDAVKIPRIAPSLGGVESLIEQPLVMSYYQCTPEDRRLVRHSGQHDPPVVRHRKPRRPDRRFGAGARTHGVKIAMLIWYGAGAVAAIAIAWLAALVHASGHAPIGLVSLVVGIALGVVLAKIAATQRVTGAQAADHRHNPARDSSPSWPSTLGSTSISADNGKRRARSRPKWPFFAQSRRGRRESFS